MSDEPPIDPIPPNPERLPPLPNDPAAEFTKYINALDRDNENEQVAAVSRIRSLLGRLKQNFASSYKVVPTFGRGEDYWLNVYRRERDAQQYVYEQNLDLASQADRLRAEIEMLREHVTKNTYQNIRTQALKLHPPRSTSASGRKKP